jgi:hypothetical protein
MMNQLPVSATRLQHGSQECFAIFTLWKITKRNNLEGSPHASLPSLVKCNTLAYWAHSHVMKKHKVLLI